MGGNVLSLHDLVAALSNDQPVYGLRAKGLDGSDPVRSVEEAAEFYIREMRTIQLKGPYFIGGVSFGGLVAFEMARKLSQDGEEIGLLALFDAQNFAYGRTRPKTIQFYETAKFFRRRLTYHIKKMRDVPIRDRARYLSRCSQSVLHYLSRLITVAGGESLNNVPVKGVLQRVGDEAGRMKERLNRVVDASIDAAKSYTPKYYDGEITLFKASEQYDSPDNDPALGWIPFARKVRVIEFQGNHMNIFHQPQVSTIASYIEEMTERNRFSLDAPGERQCGIFTESVDVRESGNS
jgi:thioesterase domain-containing protein